MSGRGTAEKGAPDAEAQFWDLYSASLPSVYGFLLRRSDRQTAEDLTQEVFVNLAQRAGRGEDLTLLTTGWLVTVARSRLMDHFRAQRRAERNLRLAWWAAEPEYREGFAVAEDELAALDARTERALDSLAAPERCALVLHHLDGYSVDEVAEAIGRSYRATESLLARARRKFRAALEEVADA